MSLLVCLSLFCSMNLSILSHGRFSLDPDLHQTCQSWQHFKKPAHVSVPLFSMFFFLLFPSLLVGGFDNHLSIFACLQCIPNNFRPLGFRMAYLHFVVVIGSGQNWCEARKCQLVSSTVEEFIPLLSCSISFWCVSIRLSPPSLPLPFSIPPFLPLVSTP